MNVAILNPGPSLARWHIDDFAGYSVLIGVNRAAFAFRCAWRVFTDFQQVKDHGEPSYPHLRMTTATAVDRLRRHGIEFTPEKLYEDLTPWLPSVNWTLYTMPAAMVLASWLGSKTIDLYGNDQTDAPDFDGHRTEHDIRNETRWQRENDIVRRLIDELNRRGVNVRRMKPE